MSNSKTNMCVYANIQPPYILLLKERHHVCAVPISTYCKRVYHIKSYCDDKLRDCYLVACGQPEDVGWPSCFLFVFFLISCQCYQHPYDHYSCWILCVHFVIYKQRIRTLSPRSYLSLLPLLA